MSMRRALLLLGAPGVGKGTYGRLLARQLGLQSVSTGDLVRKSDQEALCEMAARGALVPDETIASMLWDHVASLPEPGPILLDGFPRRVSQVGVLLKGEDRLLAVAGVHVTLRRDLLLRKLVARRTCRGCGRAYNVADIHEGSVRMPALLPEKEGVCDDCGGELYQRQDDNEAVILERLALYDRVTFPVVDALRQEGVPVHDFHLTSGVEDMTPVLQALVEKQHLARALAAPSFH